MTEDRIEISWDDLGDDRSSSPTTGAALPPLAKASSPPPPAKAVGPTVATRLGANAVVGGLVAGLTAGVAGAGLAEWINQAFLVDRPDVHEGVLAGVVGLLLGFALASWSDLSIGSVRRGLREGAVGAVLGIVAALAALGVADTLYDRLQEDADADRPVGFSLWLAWVVLGTLAGAGFGLRGGIQKMVNGTIGGLLGAGLGGLLYLELAGDDVSEFTPQLVAVAATTAGIGVAIGLVERIRREAWLQVVAGPLTGKEFILYREQVVIGSTAAADIVVTKDAQVLPVHAHLLRSPDQTVVQAVAGATVLLNGRPATTARIRSGDLLQVGSTQIRYSER